MSAVVQVSGGPVRGFVDTHPLSDQSSHQLANATEKPVQKYLGIPYGQAKRWTQATAPNRWQDVKQCTEYGPMCPQLPSFLNPIVAETPGFHDRDHIGMSEEEMFSVNVFSTGGVKEGDDVPTMVWIYGGSWRDGAGSLMLYDPTILIRKASRPMVVVTLNYRVNIFGFLASKDLMDADGLVGNYGVRDQLLALKWVNANIQKFGGDKNNVTIFGESAGAGSVGYHIGGIDPLFKRAICQSGAGSTMAYNPIEEHEKVWHSLLAHLKIDANDPERAAMARAASADDLVDFMADNPTVSWAACKESGPNAIWSSHPDVRLTNGEWVESLESVMTGCCQDEGALFAEVFGMNKSQRTVDKFVDAYGPASEHIKKLYPGIADIANFKGSLVDHPASNFLHDALFDGPVRYLAETLASRPHKRTGKRVNTYLYKSEAIIPTWEGFGWGVHHFSEIPLVFNSSCLWDDDDSRPEAKTAANFGSKWTNFAFTGRPSSDWPKYSESSRTRYVFCNDGEWRTEDVTKAGRSETALALQSSVIKSKWGINSGGPENKSKI